MSSNNEGPVLQPQPLFRRISLRFTLKTLLVALLVAALLIAWTLERNERLAVSQLAAAQLEVCDSPAKLKKVLGVGAVQVINFDDVDTTNSDYAPFAADRYADRGITIKGEGGQYAGRTFSTPGVPREGGPRQFAPSSAPNSYAPGPTAPPDSTSLTAGGNQTVITFTAGGRPARVAGFGAVFIDADWPSGGATQLTVFGWDGRQIGETQDIRGGNGSKVFRGVVVTDEKGTPLPVISRVEIINGGCWPEVVEGECVTLDDFTFDAPAPVLFATRSKATSPETSFKAPNPSSATIGPTAVFRGHTDWVMGVEFAPGSSKLVSASRDKTVRMWDLTSKKKIFQSPPLKASLETAVFTSDGKQFVVCGGDKQNNELRLCNAEDGQTIHSFVGHEGRVNRVRFSPNGKLLASSGNDKTVKIWDVSTGKNLVSIRGHKHHVYGVSFHPDGKRLASSGRDNTVRLWDVSTGKRLQLFKGHTDQVIDVEFSPDGKHLVSACDDRTIRFWDVATGKELRRLVGHGKDIRDLSFSPDGRLLASASYDKTVKVWEVSTGVCLVTLKHKSTVRTVNFSPNGMHLATACGDRTICAWDLSLFPELKKPNQPTSPDNSRFYNGLLAATLGGTMLIVVVLAVRRKRKQNAPPMEPSASE